MSKKIAIHRLWTEEEFEIVVDMIKQGSTQRVIAERLNRSYGSLQRKLQYMGKDLWDRNSWSRYISKRSKTTGLMKSYMMQSLCWNVVEQLMKLQKRHHIIVEVSEVR